MIFISYKRLPGVVASNNLRENDSSTILHNAPGLKSVNIKVASSSRLLQGFRENTLNWLPKQIRKSPGMNRLFLEDIKIIGQFDKKCIAAYVKTGNETQIWLFDQHASQERVNLEKILANEADIQREAANMKACKSSCRFGDELDNVKQYEILSQLSKCQEPFHCAHGRPTCWLLARIVNEPLP